MSMEYFTCRETKQKLGTCTENRPKNFINTLRGLCKNIYIVYIINLYMYENDV